MQIDLTRPNMTERDAAAKRTSEGTEAAAMKASKEGYRPVRRVKAPWPPSENEVMAAMYPNGFATPRHPAGLSPEETKREQTRLLTLLRSLHPMLVVDQLCKAVAYFGGIPGAPSPVEGEFPESDSINGPGSLFVGWIAEIFPHVPGAATGSAPLSLPPLGPPGTASPGAEQPAAAAAAEPQASQATEKAAADQSAPVKRARGRPKGSKTMKKDKGIAGEAVPNHASQSTQGVGEAGLAGNMGGPMGTEQTPAKGSSFALQGQTDPNSSVISTPGSKKRGRPKGSKNRPKAPANPDGTPMENTPSTQAPGVSTESPLAFKGGASMIGTSSLQNAHSGSPGSHHQAPDMSHFQGVMPGAGSTVERGWNAPFHQAQAQPRSQDSPSQIPPSRKRKAPRPSQAGNKNSSQSRMGTMEDAVQQTEASTTQGILSPADQSKRRRVSKEFGHHASMGSLDAHSSHLDTSASPNMSSHLSGSAVQPSPTSSGLNSPAPNMLNQRQQPQHQGHIYQNQNQNQNQHQNHTLNQHLQQQQSPKLGPQGLSHTSTPRQRSLLPVQGQAPASRTAQPYYQQHQQQQHQQQRQMMNQFGQSGSANFSRTMGSNSPVQQFPRPSMTANNTPHQQGPFSQPPPPPSSSQASQPASRDTSNHNNHSNNNNTSNPPHHSPSFNPRSQPPQPPPSSQQATTMGSFPAYTPDQSNPYMGMDYSGSNAAAAAAAAVAFNGSTQLEAALAEPNMRERIYHAIGRR